MNTKERDDLFNKSVLLGITGALSAAQKEPADPIGAIRKLYREVEEWGKPGTRQMTEADIFALHPVAHPGDFGLPWTEEDTRISAISLATWDRHPEGDETRNAAQSSEAR